jgi:F-type H+-transporting ATPase subunit a
MIHNVLSLFAAESEPTIHIAPSDLFVINGFTITNSMVFAWVCSVFIIVVFIISARRIKLLPKGGFSQFVEVGVEFITSLLENSLGSRQKAVKYAPYFTAIFFFIVFSNFLGLLPGVGEAFTYNESPVFRPFTADLNGTLAAAFLSLAMVQYFSIKESGPAGHLRHYFGGSLKNPLTYLAGVYEIFGEFIRLFSLALRLFLNIAIGEIIIAVFSFLGKVAAPITALPFVMLELGVAVLQAYIFVMLSITYLSLAVKHGEEAEEQDHEPTLDISQLKESKA